MTPSLPGCLFLAFKTSTSLLLLQRRLPTGSVSHPPASSFSSKRPVHVLHRVKRLFKNMSVCPLHGPAPRDPCQTINSPKTSSVRFPFRASPAPGRVTARSRCSIDLCEEKKKHVYLLTWKRCYRRIIETRKHETQQSVYDCIRRASIKIFGKHSPERHRRRHLAALTSECSFCLRIVL